MAWPTKDFERAIGFFVGQVAHDHFGGVFRIMILLKNETPAQETFAKKLRALSGDRFRAVNELKIRPQSLSGHLETATGHTHALTWHEVPSEKSRK